MVTKSTAVSTGATKGDIYFKNKNTAPVNRSSIKGLLFFSFSKALSSFSDFLHLV